MYGGFLAMAAGICVVSHADGRAGSQAVRQQDASPEDVGSHKKTSNNKNKPGGPVSLGGPEHRQPGGMS